MQQYSLKWVFCKARNDARRVNEILSELIYYDPARRTIYSYIVGGNFLRKVGRDYK